MIPPNNSTGIKLLELLGIPTERVQGVTLTCEIGAQDRLEVSRMVGSIDENDLATLFENYEVKKTGAHQVHHPQGFGMGCPPLESVEDEWTKRTQDALEQEGEKP